MEGWTFLLSVVAALGVWITIGCSCSAAQSQRLPKTPLSEKLVIVSFVCWLIQVIAFIITVALIVANHNKDQWGLELLIAFGSIAAIFNFPKLLPYNIIWAANS